MRRNHTLLFRTASLMVGLLVASAPLLAKQVVLCDSENPPYSIGAADGSEAEGGVAVALAAEIFDRIEGAELEVRLMPWSRCLQEAKTGQVDGVLKLLYNEERAAYLEFTEEPLYSMNMVFFHLPERFPEGLTWESLSDVSGYTLGVVSGSSYGALDEALKNGTQKSDAATADGQNIPKLVRGRIDFFADDRIMGLANIREAGMGDRIVATEQIINSQPTRIGISKKSWVVELLPEIDRVLKNLWVEGTASRILEGQGEGDSEDAAEGDSGG